MVTARNFAAELEREKIAQRTHEHLLVKALKGLNVGGRVYGYDNVEVKDGEVRKHVEYAINLEQAPTVVDIFQRYARGEGLRLIAKSLNAQGIPSPRSGKRGTGSWAPSALWGILRRPRYVGVIEWNHFEKTYRKGTKVRVEREKHEWLRIEAPHLRIVNDELWAAAHAQMRPRDAASTGRKNKAGRPPRYLLTGITRCVVCGGPLTVVGSRDGKNPIKAYACAYWYDRGETVCTNAHRRPVERVNEAVMGWVQANILSEELVLDSLKKIRQRLLARARSQSNDLPKLEAKAAKLRAELSNLVDILAVTPKENADSLLAGVHERQQELNTVETQMRSTKRR
jgi:hypothetical protein